MSESYGTDYEKCKKFLGDTYVLNQILMKRNGRKSQKVTRGMGNMLAGLNGTVETMKVVSELVKHNVPMRFLNRPVSGFSSGGTSKFRGFTVNTDVPVEAILSSTLGVKVQADNYKSEKEVLVIGAASLPFAPSQITYVRKDSWGQTKVTTADEIAKKADAGNYSP
jgi:hypothetical protein